MVSAQRHLALLRGELRPDEAERLWIRAERRPQAHSGVLLMTDRRLLFSGLGFVQQSQQAWPLALCASRGVTPGRPAELRIALPGGEERFAGREADLRRVAALLGAAAEPGDGLAGELERLAALHASGALSEAEFASAKARLLA